jgi:hypothetical protein
MDAEKLAWLTLATLSLALRALAFAVLAFAAAPLYSQIVPKVRPVSTAVPAKVAAVKSFRIVQEEDGPAVEILSTLPLRPQIKLINDPTRLVIDLPNARIDMAQKRIEIQTDRISTLRANQFQETPPVARVVVDLLAPRTFEWKALGNRLVVHLGKNPTEESHSPFVPAMAPALTPAVLAAPKAEIRAVRAAGPLALASDTGRVGSSFTAGADTAVLSLSSGGELRVCPGTTVSIIPSANRHNLLLGMNSGAIEAHLDLDDSTDSVMTPDFRITLEGPGEFHYAFSTDRRGDTCVRALPGNSATATATELLGDGSYPIKATDQLVFRGGRLDRVDMNVPLECGCPPPRQNVERAANEVPVEGATASEARPAANADSMAMGAPPAESSGRSGTPAGTAAADARTAREMHVQVSAPLVFHASGPPPAPVEDVRAAAVEMQPVAKASTVPTTRALRAPATGPGLTLDLETSHRGFFRRIGGWFAKVFRSGS